MNRFIKNQKGSTLITFAVIGSALALVVMSAIGFTKFDIAKTNIQNALDNALLSGVSYTISHPNTNTTTMVTQFLNSNLMTTGITVNGPVNVTYSNAGTSPQWTAQANVTVGSIFDSIAPVNFTQTSVVQWIAPTNEEIVFALNTSTSMCLKPSTTTTDVTANGGYGVSLTPYTVTAGTTTADTTNCKKLLAAQGAVSSLLGTGILPVKNPDGSYVYKVGIVPFNHKVLFPGVYSVLNASTNCPAPTASNPYPDKNCFVAPKDAAGLNIPSPLASVEADSSNTKAWVNNEGKANGTTYYTDMSDAWPLTALQPLKSITSNADITVLQTYVSGISQSTFGNGWVRTDVGMLTSALMLDPAYTSSFGGATPAAFPPAAPATLPPGTMPTSKSVILITDGANIGCCFSDYPDTAAQQAAISNYSGPAAPNFSDQYLYSYEADNAAMVGGTAGDSFGAADTSNLSSFISVTAGDTNFMPTLPAQGVCDQLKAQGVTVYVLMFDYGANKVIDNLYQSCATSSSFFFGVTSANMQADLNTALSGITQSLTHLRIIQ